MFRKLSLFAAHPTPITLPTLSTDSHSSMWPFTAFHNLPSAPHFDLSGLLHAPRLSSRPSTITATLRTCGLSDAGHQEFASPDTNMYDSYIRVRLQYMSNRM